MDGNGNKVQTLRQQFEILNYDEIPIPKSKNTSNFGDIISRRGDEAEVIQSMILNRNEFCDAPLPPKHLHLNRNQNQNLLPEEDNNRRNGIYVSNSITLHCETGDDEDDRQILFPSHHQCLDEDELGMDEMENESEFDKNGNFNDSGSQNGGSTGVYGKIKRSNAFRKKDIIDSPDPRFTKSKSKLSLERVKSLDTSGLPGSGYQKKNVESEVSRASSVCLRSSNVSDHSRQQQQQTHHQQKAINIVAPYHVSEIYSHDRKLQKSSQQQGGRAPLQQQYDHYAINNFRQGQRDYALPLPNKSDRYSPKNHNNESLHHPPVSLSPVVYHHRVPLQSSSTDRPLSVSRDNNIIKTAMTKPTTNFAAPPEKPPRTFLYDILSDQAPTFNHHQQRPLITTPTTTTSTTTTLDESKSQRLRNGFYYPPGSSSAMAKSSESHVISQLTVDSSKVKPGKNETNSNPSVGSPPDFSKENESHRSGPHYQNHPALVRSKTESQIVVKNKNRTRPSDNNNGGNVLDSRRCGNNILGTMKNSSNSGLGTVISPDYIDYHSGNQRIYPDSRLDSSSGSGGIHNHHVVNNSGSAPSYERVVKSSSDNFPRSNVVGGGGVDRILQCHRTDSVTNLPSHGHLPFAIDSAVNNYKNIGNGKGGSSTNGHKYRSENRLGEKSKSEWALNQVLNGNDEPIVGISGDRRNTVANTTGNNSNNNNNNIHNIHPTGHLSLDSNASSSNSAKLFRSNIQQSIQNLMNQLFSTSGINGKDATSSTDSGIQLGSESLSSCDTPVGDSTTDTGDSDIENEVETSNNARQVVEARKGYIRQVSSFRVKESQNRVIQNSKKPLVGEALFECLLVVGLNRDAYTGTYHPYIKEMFPPNTKLAAGVEQFCFPDSFEWPFHEGVTAQSYTLAITDHRGGRKYGCCFRILPEGANICIPITYCLISSNRAIGFYREVLKEITLRHGCSEYHKRYWMEQLYNKPFPLPDGDVCIQEPVQEETYVMSVKNNVASYASVNNFVQPKMISIRRKADHRLDDKDLVTLLTKIDAATVIKIFGSMLHERKVVLISRALSTLSLCVEALESMLYPFTWQHTFVPILPLNMPDFLDAPSPYLIGVLRSSQSPWDKNFEDGMVIDLDMNKVIRCVGDEGSILPKRIYRKLRDSLQFVLSLSDQGESTKNVLFSECFIRMFVDVMGHYGNHIILQADGAKMFEREAFIRSSDTKATQNFLDWFSETSMFHFFIENRLKESAKQGLFEQRIMGDQTHQNYGAQLPFKNSKFVKNNRTFGINWLKDAFVMKQ